MLSLATDRTLTVPELGDISGLNPIIAVLVCNEL